MKLFLRYTLFACLVVLGFVGETAAQVATSVNPSGLVTRQYAMDTVYSAKRIREDDKMYQISVWRRIDLREKYNTPLYGSGDTKENGIINHIYKAVKQNALEIFGGDGFDVEFSRFSPKTVFACTYYGNVVRSANSGQSTSTFFDDRQDGNDIDDSFYTGPAA